jgi:UBX domain-containing protein 1
MDRIVNNAMNDAKEGSREPPPEGMRKITLYRNGFTVDDGPFRDLESPENKKFIASLSDGYIPRELQGGDKEVHIGLDDRRGEDYRAPTPPPYVAYSGDAMTLGGGSTSVEEAYIFATSPNPIPTVNASEPVTLIQVKLQNGKKLKLK